MTLEELREAILQDDERIHEENLRNAEVEERAYFLASIERRKRTCWPKQFQRDFRVDPSRSSSMDLPAGVRVMVYKQIFDHKDVTRGGMKLACWSPSPVFYNWRSDLKELSGIMSVLKVLGTLNTTIRKEARTIFWSLVAFELQQDHRRKQTDSRVSKPYYMAIFERFLYSLGDDGRSVVISLVVLNFTSCWCCSVQSLDLTGIGHHSFIGVCGLLPSCMSLTTLRVTISEHYLFRNDQAALEDFLLRGRVLKGEGLMAFQKILQGLPKLVNVDLDLPGTDPDSRIIWHEFKPFLQFAFTSERHNKLWTAVAEILRGTKLQLEAGHVHFARSRDRTSATGGPQTPPSLKSGEEEWVEWQ
jgi:hypothetical protein